MAHESFENAAIAARDERAFRQHQGRPRGAARHRPDLHGTPSHLLGQQGGWPLTMFLTPDGEPFWGGTYFPPEPRYGRPGFADVLSEVAASAASERDTVDSNTRGADRRRSPGSPGRAAGAAAAAGARQPRATQAGPDVRHRPRRPRAARPSFPRHPCSISSGAQALRQRRCRRLAMPSLHTLDQHLPGRHLRSSRRRLRPLLASTPLAGAAFREDALRQRPAARRC